MIGVGGACSVHGGDEKCVQNLVGGPEGKGLIGCVGVGGRIILKWIVEKSGLGMWIGFAWLMVGTGCGLL
jgi:hypothetical protein